MEISVPYGFYELRQSWVSLMTKVPLLKNARYWNVCVDFKTFTDFNYLSRCRNCIHFIFPFQHNKIRNFSKKFLWLIMLKNTNKEYSDLSGLQNIFGKFFPGFQNFLQVFKITRFRIYFKLKIEFKVKTVFSGITTLKRYLKASLNVFLIIFLFLTTKKKFYIINFWCQIKLLLLNM